jgi:hypothetical protein
MKDSYFIITNKDEKPIKKGEQIYFTYGRRNNSHLLLHYSFCYENNMYEFIEMPLRMKPVTKWPCDTIIRDDGETENVQTVQLKTDQFNHTLMAYLRLIRKENFGNMPLIGRALALKFEKMCMKAYLELCVYHL